MSLHCLVPRIIFKRWFLEEAADFLAKELRDWRQVVEPRGGVGVVGYTPSGLFNKVFSLKMPQEFRLRKEIPSLKLTSENGPWKYGWFGIGTG